MNFLHQPLAWAFLLVLVPLLIHLINMMRHRRVKWAAMEFLLASYKKHKKWIWLKQLLLLLMRMAAIAAVVAIMAQWVPPDHWAKLLGGKVTHHYIALDDSFSMTDRAGGESAFDRARQVVARIVERAAAQDTPQKITLVRYSRAARAAEAGDAALVADVGDQLVSDGAWRESFDAQRRALEASYLSVGPEAALAVIGNLLAEKSDESRIVYVVSDFRRQQWESPARLDGLLQQIERAGAQVHLVDCAGAERANLAVTGVAPLEGTRSAGVPLFVDVQVKNFGPAAARDVELTVTSYSYGAFDPVQHGEDPAAIKPQPLDKRTEKIEDIAAGETVSRRVQVRFPIAGKHVVEARLPEDAVAADNARFCVVNFPEGEPVLIVDGNAERRNAYFLSAVFQPQVRGVDGASAKAGVRTGIVPAIEDAARLRDISPEALREYRAVYLLDVPRLDEAAIRKLEAYVREGGGLAFFLGDEVSASHYRQQLYAQGQGLFPMPLGELELLVPGAGAADDEDRVPDFEVVEHPVLSIFASGDPRFRRGVVIGTYYTMADDWKPPTGRPVKVLATLRDQARTPLVVEQQFGQGRVMAFNTTLAPLWNNWARGQGGAPSFVVTMLQLHAHLAAPLRSDQSQLVGTAIRAKLDPESFQPDARCIVPAVAPLGRKPIAVRASLDSAGSEDSQKKVLAVSLGHAGSARSLHAGGDGAGLTEHPGIYEIWGQKKTGELEVQRFALNVDPEEGDLARVTPQQLAASLRTKFQLDGAGEIEYQLAGSSAGSISEYILYGLIVLLLLEQVLAYSASYHPARSATANAAASRSPLAQRATR